MSKYDQLLKRQRDFYETNSTRDLAFRIQALKNLKYLLKAYEQKFMRSQIQI